MPNFLHNFPVLMLDMNSTFMFGEDRFGPEQNYFQTYRECGGKRLKRETVHRIITIVYAWLETRYKNPAYFDDFPSLREAFEICAPDYQSEHDVLEAVFSQHERGQIPKAYADLLHRLSQNHQLGVVSNIWVKKPLWLEEFLRAGIANIWQTLVFSSDSRSIKPSPKLFEQAFAAFNCPRSEMLFIGDSLRVDITPAKRLGLTTVWINGSGAHFDADVIMPTLLHLMG